METPLPAKNRFVCIHGHFYQPPRENPWTGVIERQPSAGEDHDWNCRIARQCYVPNGHARIEGEAGKTLAVVNNYAKLSFNFGPTLLSWYERAHPGDYRLLLRADKESARRLDGHGNALAQAYNHVILPLANRRDQETQVRWGLADFEGRFERRAEALWLPETACGDETLRLLIDHGLKYVLLAPTQAARVRPLGAPRWTEVDAEALDTTAPYRWLDRRGGSRAIDVFFYHGALSQATAFGKLMSNSGAAAERIAAAFPPAAGSRLASICTDGETYGHHEVFAEMGLAHLFQHELPDRGLEVVNFGYFLSKHPPVSEVELRPGPQGLGTAWSCSHGVGRWLEDCGCGGEGHQKWRRPLRDALDWLRDRLGEVFEKEGVALLKDPWAARDAYVAVLLDPAAAGPFLHRHGRGSLAPDSRRRALALLEMQKFALFMYTSCGWFFADISGLEAAQNLRYAARALELARDVASIDLEPELVRRLSLAPSNNPEYGDGAGVWRRLVRATTAAV